MAMDLSKHLMDIHKKLSSDEKLLRLLFYRATSKHDNVLDNRRPNIIGNDFPLNSGQHNDKSMTANEVINDVIRLSKIVDDLSDDQPQCLISTYFDALDIVYDTGGRPLVNLLDVNIVFDLYAHSDFEKIDFRLMKILTRIYELFYNKDITGMLKFQMTSSAPIDDKEELNKGYVGYRLKFKFRTSTL